ncbi:hypothetical protein GJ496_004805 [Pomphorhynchus laevis]|nr:hypothetical protein GJ496_004805 [Pomphorhynchus laevis]
MDVSELLDFQPKKPVITTKRRLILTDEEKSRILQELEKSEEEPLDEATVRKMTTVLEKRIARNQEMRIKYVDIPDKFMQSEIELNDSIQEFSAVATKPELYSSLVEFGTLQLLINLVSHENTDISVTVIKILQELTDVEFENESSICLIDALVDLQCLSNLILCLKRLNESVKEEADGVHNILAAIENICDLNPSLIETTAIEHNLMEWILKRINAKRPYDENKLYACEILSICVQESDRVKLYIANNLNAIEIILQELSRYKRSEPQSLDEIEYMENMFSCLCSLLLDTETHHLFMMDEGMQLMNLMIRERKLSRYGALKTLYFVLNGIEASECCQKYVEILGLRVIFPLLMKPLKGNKDIGVTHTENEERVIAIVHALIRNCTGIERQRVLLKFTENDHEKVERLVELHQKYAMKVKLIDEEIANEVCK